MPPKSVTDGPIEGKVVVEKVDGVVIKAGIEVGSATQTTTALPEAALAALVIATGEAAIASDDEATLVKIER